MIYQRRFHVMADRRIRQAEIVRDAVDSLATTAAKFVLLILLPLCAAIYVATVLL